MTPDMINGLFELFGGLLVLNHCRAVLRDKSVAGVSIISTAVFTMWGCWNLYYYPSLDQMWSFFGGMVIFGANSYWVYLMMKYSNKVPSWLKIK